MRHMDLLRWPNGKGTTLIMCLSEAEDLRRALPLALQEAQGRGKGEGEAEVGSVQVKIEL